MKLNPSGEIEYSTFLGIDSSDGGVGIALDKGGTLTSRACRIGSFTAELTM
jgi:hypothetical protein